MISIDVQTDAKNQKNPDGQNRLWVANQERSVQETLYDGEKVDIIGSHNYSNVSKAPVRSETRIDR